MVGPFPTVGETLVLLTKSQSTAERIIYLVQVGKLQLNTELATVEKNLLYIKQEDSRHLVLTNKGKIGFAGAVGSRIDASPVPLTTLKEALAVMQAWLAEVE